jgi:hypothetical protein
MARIAILLREREIFEVDGLLEAENLLSGTSSISA